jgi:hypothetical protein
LRLLPLRYAPGLQAAKRKKRCQRKQTRLAKQHPSGANTDPYLKTGVLGSATRATSERGSAGSDEESLERERQNAISREPTVKLDFVTKK